MSRPVKGDKYKDMLFDQYKGTLSGIARMSPAMDQTMGSNQSLDSLNDALEKHEAAEKALQATRPILEAALREVAGKSEHVRRKLGKLGVSADTAHLVLLRETVKRRHQ